MSPRVAEVGKLYGVGVGPGDPELLTVKAQRVLSLVPVVCVPVKAFGERSFARSIVGELIDTEWQEVLELVFPMTKDAAAAEPHWQEAAKLIWKRLAEGKDCAFISEGDPLIYSTFIDIFRILVQLHPSLDIEIVPGISSVNAAAARSLTPLVDGDERLALLPATFEGEKLREVLRDFDTVVLFKIHSVLDRVLAVLEEVGLAGKAVCITRCTGAEEVIERDIRRLRGKKLDYFSLLIVRKRS